MRKIKLRNAVGKNDSDMNEGIDVDKYRNVTMTDEHENRVDTSVENNPTILTNIIPNVKVWSILKREKSDNGDGNPLLYGLKNEKGYHVTNIEEVKERIETIIEKFIQENSGIDVTIEIPSTNELNRYIASSVSQYCTNPKFLDKVLVKMSVEEVDDFVYEKDSLFRQHYGEYFYSAYKFFQNYCNKMTDGVFRFHLVKDMEMRKTIEHTIKFSDEFYSEYVDAINDKNILIVDDSITNGQTLQNAYRIISTDYAPKTITILTLFSPLYD